MSVSAIKERSFNGMRWVIACICLFINFTVFFVRNSFPVALLSLIDDSNSTYHQRRNQTLSFDYHILLQLSTDEKKPNDWTASRQSLALSAYFWGFLISRLFVSRVVEITGQRKLVAIFLASNGILELLAPISASVHPLALTAIRSLIGFGYGAFPAAISSIISSWAPRRELASMFTTSVSGATLGTIIAYFSSGILSEIYTWKITFWIGALLNLIALPLWVIVVRNRPEEHPWLSETEKKILEENKDIKHKKVVPWKKILKTPYIYICMISMFAGTMMDSVFSIVGPSFLTTVGGLDITAASSVCGLTYFIVMILMLVEGRISDLLINRKILSKINTRKLFNFIGTFIASIALILMSVASSNLKLLIFMFILAGGLSKAVICSYPLSVIDFAPNFVGTVQGLLAFGFLGSALTPIICSAFLSLGNGWDKTFYLATGVNLLSCIFYCSFMTAEPQQWNFET